MLAAIILTGIFVGIISTYFGLGGGAIIVPVLYTIFPEMAPETVISTSLGVIFINNFLNIFKYKKHNLRPHYKLIIPMACLLLVGAFLGTIITAYMPPIWIKRLVSLVLVASSIFTFIRKAPEDVDTDAPLGLKKRQYFLGSLFGLLAGIIATTTGIGGGIVIIPVMIHLIRLPFTLVPVNTNIIVLCGATLGTILYAAKSSFVPAELTFGLNSLIFGPVNLNFVLVIAFFAFFTGFLGLKWSQSTKPFWAKQIFAVMLFIAALNIFRTTL